MLDVAISWASCSIIMCQHGIYESKKLSGEEYSYAASSMMDLLASMNLLSLGQSGLTTCR